MYSVLILLGFSFQVCYSSMVVIDYKSPKVSEMLFNLLQRKAEGNSGTSSFNKLAENQTTQLKLCANIFGSNYFHDDNTGMTIEVDPNSHPESKDDLTAENVIVFPGKPAVGIKMIHCSPYRLIEDIFISDGFDQDVYFVLRKNKKGEIVPLGLGTLEPLYEDLDQNALEKRYVKDRSDFNAQSTDNMMDSTGLGEYLGALTEPEIYTLVNLISVSTFFKEKKLEFRNGASHINYEFISIEIRFETQLYESEPEPNENPYYTEEERNCNKMPFRYFTRGLVKFLAYVDNIPDWYFIARSYDHNHSLYIFKQREDGKVILFGYLYNVMILNKVKLLL